MEHNEMTVYRDGGHALLIDLSTMAVLRKVPTVQHAEFWADILLPNKPYVIGGPERRYYSKFEHAELCKLYESIAKKKAPTGVDYGSLIAATAREANDMAIDSTDLTVLRKKLGREPTPPFIPKAPKLPPPAAPRAAPQHSSARAAAPPWAPPSYAGQQPQRVQRTASAGSSTPGAAPLKGATALVWTVCDELKAAGKTVDRKTVIPACEARGINPSTASVQFGKWKASQG